MTEPSGSLRVYRQMIERGAGLEQIIRALRDDGFSKVQSIKALVDLDQATLATAKQIVHDSKTWADVRARDDDFQDRLS